VRVLIYAINFFPEQISTGKYTGELAYWLAARGYQVRVVTGLPHYPQWKVANGYHSWKFCLETPSEFNGHLNIFRSPLWVPRQPAGVRRILHLLSFVVLSFPLMLWQVFWRPHVVITVEPTVLCAPTALLVSRLAGANVWLHIQDFELEAAHNLRMFRGRRLLKVLARLEGVVFRLFDRVSSISPAMVRRVVAKGVRQDRTRLLPNWVDTSHIFPDSSTSAYRRLLGISETTVVVLYAGNIGRKQGLEIIPQVADCLADRKDVLLVVAGDGAERASLAAMAKQRPNMRMIGLVDSSRLNDLLNMADIHLLVQRGDVEDLVMPSKLTGMCASGRPVIATANAGTQVAEVVMQRGMVVPPGDAVAVAGAIRKLADDAWLRKLYGDAARKYAVCHWGKELVLTQFESELISLEKLSG